MPNGPSRHLSWAELACKDGTPYPIDWRETRGHAIGEMFEAFRAGFGRPLVVLSGYRTTTHNASIGGARLSQHLLGLAIDIRTPLRTPLKTFHTLATNYWMREQCKGLGLYPWGVHLDLRDGRRVLWTANGLKDS